MVWAFLSSTIASIQSTERSVLSTLRLVDVLNPALGFWMRKVEMKLLRYAVKLYAYRKVGTHYRPFSIQETNNLSDAIYDRLRFQIHD